MSRDVRVMLCDDSALMRRLIRTGLKAEPTLKVVAEAQDGRDAVEQVKQAPPDILVMDIEMPIMDGVEAVRQIRRFNRSMPIIMFSSLTTRGSQASLDALAAGATDFAAKPTGAGHYDQAMDQLKRDLIPKLTWWAKRGPRPTNGGVNHVAQSAAVNTVATAAAAKPRGRIAVLAIGVSTGGPQALSKLMTGLPRDLPVPVLIVQHMPPVFTGLLADRLRDQSGHDVKEASDGDLLRPGVVLIAPGDHHMTIRREGTMVAARLNQEPPVNSCRPSVDPLFHSVAHCYGHHALGVILTGMGQDGLRGAKKLRESGARIFAQDQASSVVWGMPGEIVKNGLADCVLPIDQMAKGIMDAVQAGRSLQPAMVT